MIVKINKTEEIRDRLRKEGKVNSLDSNEHIQAMVKMNKALEDLKREYLIKDKLSQISASQTVLNS
jgi:hypothetical protein